MKRLLLFSLLIFVSVMIYSCIEIEDVTSISLNWVPEEMYERGETESFAGKEIQVTTTGDPYPKPLTADDITITGSGVSLDGSGLYTDKVGKYTVNIEYSGFNISFFYYVNDPDITNQLNSFGIGWGYSPLGKIVFTDRTAFNTYIRGGNPGGTHPYYSDFIEHMGLTTYYDEGLLGLDLGDWQFSIFFSRNALPGNEFQSAYQAQQIIIAGLLHGYIAREAMEYLDGIFTDRADDVNYFKDGFMLDMNVLALDYIDLWNTGEMTHMQTPFFMDAGEIPAEIAFLGDMLDKTFNGGRTAVLHPNEDYSSWDSETLTLSLILHTVEDFPGILKISNINELLAEYLYNSVYGTGGTVFVDYQDMASRIVDFLIDYNNAYFDYDDVTEIPLILPSQS